MIKPTRPEDILSEEQNKATFDGVIVRKGTIAAFIKNIECLEDTSCESSLKEEALSIIKELAPAVVTTGVFKHVVFKNSQVQKILEDTALSLSNSN